MFEVGKEYTTKNGLRARTYASDGWGRFCIHGAIFRDGGWLNASWDKDGVSSNSSKWDLTPPIVVTDDEVEAFRETAAGLPIGSAAIRAGLEAAIRLHLSKRWGA